MPVGSHDSLFGFRMCTEALKQDLPEKVNGTTLVTLVQLIGIWP